jgi:hypothetical protein
MKRLAVAVIFGVQVAWVFADQIFKTRYGSWGALQALTLYDLSVQVNGRTLDLEAACARYRLDTCGLNSRSPFQIFAAIRQYETTYGKEDGARVELEYHTNRGPAQKWVFPEEPK